VIFGLVAGAQPAARAAAATNTTTDWTMQEGADVSAVTGVDGARVVDFARPVKSTPASLVVRQVPVTGGARADFTLESFDIFTPDARIVEMSDSGERPLPRPAMTLYRGRSVDGAGDMFLAVDGDKVQGVVWHGGKTEYMLPSEDGKIVMAPGASMPAMNVVAAEVCGADYLPENQQALARWNEQEVASKSLTVNGPLRETDFMLDVNQSLTARLGGTTGATNYITLLMGAASAIYQRDINARWRISTLTLWTTADPFGGSDSSGQLANYRSWCSSNRAGVARDVAHLFGNANVTNYGGIAYLGVLCNSSFGYGVSNIYGTVAFPTPSYHWDIEVTAHEIGHNYGSPHTHCYSPPIDMCYNGESGCYTGASVATNGTIMSYCHLTSGGISLNFSQREIDVIRGGADSASCAVTVATTNRDTIGVYVPDSGLFFLRNQHLPGQADVTVGFGPAGQGWIPLSGDWNNDGIDTIGLYNPANGFFFLKNSNTPGAADLTFGFGPAGQGWIPITGDWNGDGIDTVGLYNPANGFFFLRNSNTPGAADRTFGFGPTNLRPIVGDWNGDGIDTVGVYSAASGAYFLRNVHSGGAADITVVYGPAGQTWKPILGDWNGDSLVTVGLYAPAVGTYFLRNANAGGPADLTFGFGPANLTPLVGNWDGQ
jgi:hypothetical protein